MLDSNFAKPLQITSSVSSASFSAGNSSRVNHHTSAASLALFTGTGKITLSSPSGEYLTEIRITGCEQAYQMKISGQQKCELPSSTSEAATHEMVCLVSGSALKWGTREVSFEGYETFGLSSGKQFSLQKS